MSRSVLLYLEEDFCFSPVIVELSVLFLLLSESSPLPLSSESPLSWLRAIKDKSRKIPSFLKNLITVQYKSYLFYLPLCRPLVGLVITSSSSSMCSLSWIFMTFLNNYPKIKNVGCFFFLRRVQTRIIRILQLLKDWFILFITPVMLPYSLWNLKKYGWMTKPQLDVKQIRLRSII